MIREGLGTADESLKTWLDTWLGEYKKGVAKNTFELNERNVKNHILPCFKNILIKDLKPLLYQKFINHLAEQDYSKRTVEIVHSTMYNSFEKAKTIGMVEKNPCEGVESLPFLFIQLVIHMLYYN